MQSRLQQHHTEPASGPRPPAHNTGNPCQDHRIQRLVNSSVDLEPGGWAFETEWPDNLRSKPPGMPWPVFDRPYLATEPSWSMDSALVARWLPETSSSNSLSIYFRDVRKLEWPFAR